MITTNDLLTMQDTITSTVRYEVGQARTEFKERIEELKAWQIAQDRRAERHDREIAALHARMKSAARTLLGGLSTKQRAAIWTALVTGAGVALERGSHYVSLLIQAYVGAKGHP